MIILGRKRKFGGAETLAYYSVVDLQLLRILRRCSIIDTLHINVPVGTFGISSMELIRAYVGNTKIRLVKIPGLLAMNNIW